MNTLTPFHKIDGPYDDALRWTKQQLAQASLRAIQTFDLHTVRHALEGCPCPQHDRNRCDCQMVILLVYGNEGEPVTLILHGNDRQTWVSVTSNALQQAEAKLIAAIQRALTV